MPVPSFDTDPLWIAVSPDRGEHQSGGYAAILYILTFYCRVSHRGRPPLLHIVNVDGQYGENEAKIYDSPHYMPLKHKLVHMIEIDIRDSPGKPILFLSGTVIVKLHFRRKRSSYFK